MRILTVTPFDSSNFGAFLQAYCLKSVLESMGHTVYHRLTRPADYVRHLYYHETPETEEEQRDLPAFARRLEIQKKVYRCFLEDQRCFRVVDPETEPADLYILGSDEIWNFRKAAFRQPLFWGAGMHPVISYAASMGDAEAEQFSAYPELREALCGVGRYLVRDERTRQFVREVTGREATAVCDPTLLVPVEQYGNTFCDPYLQEHDCLLIYAYKIHPTLQRHLRTYADARGMKLVSCCFAADWCDHVCICGPLQFSALIRQCREVFTTTFHGSIFCILNHARFVSVAKSPKTSQLLEQLSLTERMLPRAFNGEDSSAETIGQVMERTIDYGAVDETIRALRQTSLEELTRAIREMTGG